MKVKVTKEGPYEVTGKVPLKTVKIEADEHGTSVEWVVDETFNVPEEYHLCRCGHSKNKPFCDASHTKVDFDGEETANNIPYLEGAKKYEGSSVSLLDNEQYCVVARFCDRGIGVWDAAINSDDPDNAKLATEEACDCPSGRLVIVDKEGNMVEPNFDKEIYLIEDTPKKHLGSIWVRGGIQVEGADGKKYEMRNRITLCRCGESSNMPFCDATHLDCPHMAIKKD